jgi:hypothetical protein
LGRVVVRASEVAGAFPPVSGRSAGADRTQEWVDDREYVAEKEPKAMQRFLNLTAWDSEDLRDLNLDYSFKHSSSRHFFDFELQASYCLSE